MLAVGNRARIPHANLCLAAAPAASRVVARRAAAVVCRAAPTVGRRRAGEVSIDSELYTLVCASEGQRSSERARTGEEKQHGKTTTPLRGGSVAPAPLSLAAARRRAASPTLTHTHSQHTHADHPRPARCPPLPMSTPPTPPSSWWPVEARDGRLAIDRRRPRDDADGVRVPDSGGHV
eukprot:scaffold81436_cov23-Tisochrysis_lutea.AAC.2